MRSRQLLALALAAAPLPAVETDPATGLVEAEHWQLVRGWCTGCHSAAQITAQGLTRAGWAKTIAWMQETQNLRAMDARTRERILDYLAAHYGPEARPTRRRPLPARLLPPPEPGADRAP